MNIDRLIVKLYFFEIIELHEFSEKTVIIIDCFTVKSHKC